MANIYVRQGATGSATGADWTNAYTSFPAMGSIARGDTIYIADTTSTLGDLTLSKAASSTTRITIKKATVADHGTSTGWSDTYGDGQAVFGKLAITTGYWTIDGQTRSGIRSGYGFKLDGNTSPSSTTCIAAGNTAPSSCPSTIIRYVEVHGSGDQTDTYNDDGLVTPITGGSSDMTVEYCWFHDFGSVPLALRFADNFTLQYCVVERNDSSPTFHAEGVVLAQSTGITIRYNLFSDIEGSAIIGTPYATTNALSNTAIYGNVFEMPQTPQRGGVTGAVALWDIVSTGYFRIYNNTVVGIQASKVSGHSQYTSANPGFLAGLEYESTNSIAELDIRNNLFVDCDAVSNPNDDTSANITTFTWSHQAYYNTTNTADPSSGTKQVLGSDPLPNWETGTYTLNLATTAGDTLSSPYNTDPTGATRGSDGTWDRGAYEYVAGADVTAPTVTITAPTSSTTYSTSATPLTTLAGTASDNVAVSSVAWSNDRGGSGSATGTTSWSVASITLSSGDNVITVTATDSSSNTGTDTLTVTYTPSTQANIRNTNKQRFGASSF